MSYAEYLRRKEASAIKILATSKPTDASLYTYNKRLEASVGGFVNGQIGKAGIGKGTTLESAEMRMLERQHSAQSYFKLTTRPKDSSNYTSFSGGLAIRDSTKPSKPLKLYTEGCYTIDEPSTFTGGQRTATTVSTNASTIVYEKECPCTSEPHTEGKPAGPVFVDTTVSLSGYTQCTTANHGVKEMIGPSDKSRTTKAPIQPVEPQDVSPYKVGAAIAKIPYVEKHHGNDTGVNPKRPFKKYQGNGPPHLKINTPLFRGGGGGE